MSTSTLPRRPRREKPPEPVHGTCRWVNRPQLPYGLGRLMINGVEYDTECHVVNEQVIGVRLVKDDDTTYDIDAGGEHFTCDCPDGEYRPNRPGGCKHIRAAQVAGLLPSAPLAVLDRMRRPLPQDTNIPPVSGDAPPAVQNGSGSTPPPDGLTLDRPEDRPVPATPAPQPGFRSLGDMARHAPEVLDVA